MDANERELILKAEVHQLVGCAMEVLNELGHGFLEKPYENALVVEFNRRGVPYVQQPKYEVTYKSVKVGEYVPDLVCFGLVVVDTKTVDSLGNHEIGQMLNFKCAKLEWKRVVLEANREWTRMDANRSGAEIENDPPQDISYAQCVQKTPPQAFPIAPLERVGLLGEILRILVEKPAKNFSRHFLYLNGYFLISIRVNSRPLAVQDNHGKTTEQDRRDPDPRRGQPAQQPHRRASLRAARERAEPNSGRLRTPRP